MRKLCLIIFFSVLCLFSFSQENEKVCMSVGILQGGGGLLGADFEIMATQNIGVQLGVGLVSFGAACNIHLQPSIRSHAVSITYWHQGIGDTFAQDAIGSSFVFRGKKWFTFQAGLAVPMNIGPAMPSTYNAPPVMAIYSLGAYLPF